jgi:predicted Zn finger-like uncharacterized protein
MIIKCPKCSTGYNIPEKLIADKPRKMRCSRCQNVFAITRRAEQAPTGYEEFTGKQHLPNEFAFLKESAPQSAPPPPPAPEPKAGLYDSVAGEAAGQVETIPLEPRVVSPPTKQPSGAPAEATPPAAAPAPAEQPAQAPVPPPAPAEPPQQPPAADPQRPSAPSGAEDIYGTPSAWETEAPLELGGYAIADESPPAGSGQLVGKVMTAIIILVILLFVFVAWRNGWSISLSDLPGQFAFAFSGDSSDAVSIEARDLEVTISERNLVIADDKTAYLVVNGTIFNAASTGRSEAVLLGRLLDPTGEVRDESRGPCGKIIDDPAIKATAKGAMGGHFRQGGSLFDCTIKPEGSTVFQLIFEEVPLDYDSKFSVEVKAVSASAYTPG